MKYPLALLFCLAASPALAQVCPAGSTCSSLDNFTNIVHVKPTGVAATDFATLQAAVSGARPVFMAPGVWQICSPVVFPAGGNTLIGAYSNSNPGSNAYDSSIAKTLVYCASGLGAGFAPNSGYFQMTDHSTIDGITIVGNFGDNKAVSCIDAHDALAVTIKNTTVVHCDQGIDRSRSSGATISQTATIGPNVLAYGNVHYGYYGGAFVSDERIFGSWFVANNSADPGGQILLPSYSQLNDNRVEDGGAGYECAGCSSVTVNDTYFDRISGQLFLINGGSHVTIGSNRWYGYADGVHTTPDACISFQGANKNIRISGDNDFDGGCTAAFKVASGGSVTASQIDVVTTSIPPFFDANTELALSAQFTVPAFGKNFRAAPISGSTFTPNFAAAPNTLISLPSSAGPFTIAPPSPFVVGSRGTIQILQGRAGGAAVTWNAAYPSPPSLTTTANLSTYIDYKVTPSGAILLGAASPVTPATNELVGGANMNTPAGSWTGSGATVAFGGASGVDGGSTTTTITESATFGNHEIDQGTTLSGPVMTCAWAVKAGTGATRYPVASMFTSGDAAQVVFDTNGTLQQPPYVTNGMVVAATGSAPAGGGWTWIWITVDATNASHGPTINDETLYMSSINFKSSTSGFQYTGNGTTTMLTSYPACRAGYGP